VEDVEHAVNSINVTVSKVTLFCMYSQGLKQLKQNEGMNKMYWVSVRIYQE